MIQKPEVHRPWGGYTILKKEHSYWIKKLYVNAGARLSLQKHHHRREVWVMLEGEIVAQVGHDEHTAKQGDYVLVPLGRKHRITAVTDSCILEIAFGETLERDVVRYEDDYGRSTK